MIFERSHWCLLVFDNKIRQVNLSPPSQRTPPPETKANKKALLRKTIQYMWFETGVIQCHSIKRFKFLMGNFEWFARQCPCKELGMKFGFLCVCVFIKCVCVCVTFRDLMSCIQQNCPGVQKMVREPSMFP